MRAFSEQITTSGRAPRSSSTRSSGHRATKSRFKSFSEGISQVGIPAGIKARTQITDFLKWGHKIKLERAIKKVNYFMYPKLDDYPDVHRKVMKALKNFETSKLTAVDKKILQTAWGDVFGKKVFKLSKGALEGINKNLAINAAKVIAGKKGIKLSAIKLAKWVKVIGPWIGWGVVLADLVRRGMKELGKGKKEFSEANPRVPQGSNYHSAVGWY